MAGLKGKLENIVGTGVPDVWVNTYPTLELTLCGYGSTVPRVVGTSLFARLTEKQIIVDSSGNFGPITFYGNDVITPAGTYYTITVKDEYGDIAQVNAYQILDGQTYDLSTLAPYDPNQQPPPSVPTLVENLLQVVPYSATPDFAGNTYVSWQMTLNGDASPTFTNLLDGNLYTIIIIQDGTGGHAFHWPGNVVNAVTVNPDANTWTVQTFVAVTNTLYPIAPGTHYYP